MTRKLSLLLLIFVLICTLAACNGRDDVPDDAADGSAEEAPVISNGDYGLLIGTVKGTSAVNLRVQPSGEGRILGTAPRGHFFLIEERLQDAGWCGVRHQGDRVYVTQEYLYLFRCLPGTEFLIGTVSGTEQVNVRSGAGTEHAALFIANKNEQYRVTDAEYCEGWVQIDYAGESAYISSDYLTLEQVKVEDLLS